MNRLRPASSSLRRATLSIFTSQRLAGQYENGRAFPEAQRRSRADRCLKDSSTTSLGAECRIFHFERAQRCRRRRARSETTRRARGCSANMSLATDFVHFTGRAFRKAGRVLMDYRALRGVWLDVGAFKGEHCYGYALYNPSRAFSRSSPTSSSPSNSSISFRTSSSFPLLPPKQTVTPI